MKHKQFAGLIAVCIAFFFALAILDHAVMNTWHPSSPEEMYHYWIALALTVTMFAFGLSYMAYLSRMPAKYIPAIFLTVILMFIAGVLDLFYYAITVFRGEPYSLVGWSAQWKWFVDNGILPTWDWSCQMIWTLSFLVLITLIWYYTLKKV